MARWLLIVWLALVMVMPTFAVELRHDGNVTIEKGQVINDDLIMAGGTLVMGGTVSNDLIIAGGTLTIDGPVRGDLIIAGGNITVRQPVGGSIYLAGGMATISSTIGRNAVVTGGTVVFEQTAKIGRDLVVNGGDVTLAGQVGRDVLVSAKRFTLAATAHITRNLQAQVRTHTIATGAYIGGQQTFTQLQHRRHRYGAMWFIWRLLMLAGLFLLGVVFVAVAPGLTEESEATLRAHPWASLLTGLIVLIVTPIAALLLMVLVVGIPLSMVLWLLYFAALILSPIFLAIWIGRLVLRNQHGSLYWALLIGLAIYFVLRLVPGLGGLLAFVAVLFGLGSLFLAWQGRGAHPMYPVKVAPADGGESEA